MATFFKRNLLVSAALLVMAAAACAPRAEAATTAQTADQAAPVTAAGATGAANSSAADASAERTPPVGLDEIVVTATRRSADLQAVPITIEAVSAGTLKAFNITGVLQLPSLVSGLVVTPLGGNNIYLRGIGSSSTGYNEAQTAVYLDGLYLANPTLSIYSFNNIDRIEVLKGPQGTLYGRNATAGLISVITRDPGTVSRLDASIGYANYDTFTANLYAALPVTSNLSANVAVFHQKQARGWSVNVFTRNDIQKVDETGAQGKLVWRPGANTKITLGLIYDFNNRNFGYSFQEYPGTLAPDGTPYLGEYKVASRIDPSAPTRIYIGTLKAEQDLGFASLESLTGYQTSHATVTFSGGSAALGQPVTGQGVTSSIFFEQNRTFSQEFQLVSKHSQSRFDWVLGAFYYDDHTKLRLDSFTTCIGAVCTPGFIPTRNEGRPDTLSGSVFGDASYRFFKATTATVGLRYTDERRTLSGLVSPLAGYPDSVAVLPATTVLHPGDPISATVPGIPTTLVFRQLTYRFVLAQDIGDNIHVFASHNLGFKSGAFNGNAFNNPPVWPELLYATEAGVKSEFFDRRLRLNVSYFHYDYKDVQVRSVAPPAIGGNAILINAAKERVDGVDADVSLVPLRGLTINGAFEYLDAKYVNFPGTTCPLPGASRVVNGVTVGTVMNIACNLAGARPQYAPPVSATLGIVYDLETGVGAFTLAANDHYTASYPTAAQYVVNGAHQIIDASIGWTAPNKRFDAQLWVKNLTDQYVYATGQVIASFTIVPGPPRTFGATVGFHY